MSIFRLPYNNITQAASYYSEDLRDHFTNDLFNLVAHVRSYFRLLSNCLLRDISCIFLSSSSRSFLIDLVLFLY